jgi:glycine dehydrogenase
MVEPTESEPKFELDRFCDAMLSIREEIEEVISGKVKPEDSVLKGAPHTIEVVASEKWDKKYSREKAAFPVQGLRKTKFWPAVGRIDNVFGDRNVICQCPPVEDYESLG